MTSFILDVRVKIKSSKEGLEFLEDGTCVVKVHAPPIEGQANERIQQLLAQHFKVSKSQVLLLSGEKSRQKRWKIINGKK